MKKTKLNEAVVFGNVTILELVVYVSQIKIKCCINKLNFLFPSQVRVYYYYFILFYWILAFQ